MALNEACQLWIEESIDAGIEEGKTPGIIGTEVSQQVAMLFETSVQPAAIKKRAQRRSGQMSRKPGRPTKLQEKRDKTPKMPKDPEKIYKKKPLLEKEAFDIGVEMQILEARLQRMKPHLDKLKDGEHKDFFCKYARLLYSEIVVVLNIIHPFPDEDEDAEALTVEE